MEVMEVFLAICRANMSALRTEVQRGLCLFENIRTWGDSADLFVESLGRATDVEVGWNTFCWLVFCLSMDWPCCRIVKWICGGKRLAGYSRWYGLETYELVMCVGRRNWAPSFM